MELRAALREASPPLGTEQRPARLLNECALLRALLIPVVRSICLGECHLCSLPLCVGYQPLPTVETRSPTASGSFRVASMTNTPAKSHSARSLTTPQDFSAEGVRFEAAG